MFWGSKIIADGDCSHEIKRCLLLGKKAITIINIYVPNIGTSKYVRQMLKSMKEEIKNNTIIVGDFNTPLTSMEDQEIRKLTKKCKL